MKHNLIIPAVSFAVSLVLAGFGPDDPGIQSPTDDEARMALPLTVPEWADSQLPERTSPDAPVDGFTPPDPPPDPTPVPLDGGLGLLALAGAGYAAGKLRKKPSASRKDVWHC